MQTIIKSNWFDVKEGFEKWITDKKSKVYGSIVNHKGEQKRNPVYLFRLDFLFLSMFIDS